MNILYYVFLYALIKLMNIYTYIKNFKEKIDKAKQSSFYLIQELGPLAFVVREDKPISEKKNAGIKYRISLGERQTCTCGSFQVINIFVLLIILIMDVDHIK